MKKLLILVVLTAVAFAACKKDDSNGDNNNSSLEPKEEQWGFAINYTSTGCYYCGDWGAPLIHDLYNEGKTVAICAHTSSYGDPMANPVSASFQGDRPTGGGIPAFWVGDSKSSSSSAVSDLQNLKSQSPVAGIDLNYEISGGTATVDVQVKFFESGSGDYHLSTLVLEDGIDGSSSAGQYAQDGTSSSYPNDDYEHDYVLRASSVQDQAYGELIASDPGSGETINKSYSIDLDSSWEKELYVCAILWERDNSQSPEYRFVNAFQVK